MSGPGEITRLLAEWSGGDQAALDHLVPIVYDELRRLASNYMRGERPDHLLQTTALVNEAYLRLMDRQHVSCQTRTQFFAVAAQVMRRVLVDHARERNLAKRGAAAIHVPAHDAVILSPEHLDEVVALDLALEHLAQRDQRKSKVFEMRFFGGLSVEETAEALGVAPNTVIRDWDFCPRMAAS